MPYLRNKHAGFTLPEILVALAVFSVLSVLLMTALHTVLSSQQNTEEKAQRLRDVQMALLIFSRDVEQGIDRPVLTSKGAQEVAFIGDSVSFKFTHLGYANLNLQIVRSALQRVQYNVQDSALWRTSWDYLDLAPKSEEHRRKLLDNVEKITFQYVDNEGHLQDAWPMDKQTARNLPHAILLSLTVQNWGTMNQVYVISGTESNAQTTPKS